MAKMSNYLEDEILDHILLGAGGAWSAPATIYMALVITDPITDASTGSTMTEVADLYNYSRQSVVFGAATAGVSSNTVAATSFTASGGGGFGTVIATALVDTDTHGAGKILFFDNDLTDTLINEDDTLQFAVGDVDVTMD